MTDQDKIDSFIQECEVEIKNRGLTVGKYCVIIYASNVINQLGTPQFIYSSLHRFRFRALEDMKKIDTTFSVNMQLWIFD